MKLLKEVYQAFFCYIPSCHGVTPKGGSTLTQVGGTSQEKYEALCKLQAEIKGRKS